MKRYQVYRQERPRAHLVDQELVVVEANQQAAAALAGRALGIPVEQVRLRPVKPGCPCSAMVSGDA